MTGMVAGPPMVKLTDVARRAGVSVATVSRTLNNNARVDPVLAERVREVARALGYRPNGVARDLRRRHTQVWALIITDINNPFFTAVARGVEDVASKCGFSVLLCNSDEDKIKEAGYLMVAEEERVAGVILAPRDHSTDLSRLRSVGIPAVAVDRSLKQPVDTVLAHSQHGAINATRHLLAQGWRRPACVTGPPGTETAEQRAIGYRQVVEAHDLPVLVQHVPFHANGGSQATAELLDSDDPPDALFIANSVLALGVLVELQRHKLTLGRDIGLITFDDAPWAPLIDPPITVIAQPAYQIGAEAARMLAARIRGDAPEEPQSIVFETELIIRQSSRRRP